MHYQDFSALMEGSFNSVYLVYNYMIKVSNKTLEQGLKYVQS